MPPPTCGRGSPMWMAPPWRPTRSSTSPAAASARATTRRRTSTAHVPRVTCRCRCTGCVHMDRMPGGEGAATARRRPATVARKATNFEGCGGSVRGKAAPCQPSPTPHAASETTCILPLAAAPRHLCLDGLAARRPRPHAARARAPGAPPLHVPRCHSTPPLHEDHVSRLLTLPAAHDMTFHTPHQHIHHPVLLLLGHSYRAASDSVAIAWASPHPLRH